MPDDGKNRPAADVVADYWATVRPGIHSWLQHQTIIDFLTRRVTGDPKLSKVDWFKRVYCSEPVDLCLSLGCGFGGFERHAMGIGIARHIHANDLSRVAIEKAREAAAELGFGDRIDYSVVNLDELTLPAQTYDLIVAKMSVHHVFQLENLFRQCRAALKPGGIFLLDEYVGPSRFQTEPFVADLINRIRAILPPRYRTNLLNNDGSLLGEYVPSTVEHFERYDPSESVRSAEIIPTLKMYFDIVDYRPYGGAILHMLFSGIMGNFDPSDERDAALIKAMAIFEEALENAGAIDSDFALIVARPREPDQPRPVPPDDGARRARGAFQPVVAAATRRETDAILAAATRSELAFVRAALMRQSQELADLKKSRLLKLGRLIRRAMGRPVPY